MEPERRGSSWAVQLNRLTCRRGSTQWGTSVWVRDPAGNIGYINERAERLLGISSDACIGRPCYEVVAGTDTSGRPHCGPGCPILARSRKGLEIEPFELCVSGLHGMRHWIQVLIITIQTSDRNRPWLIHCAVPRDKAHRVEGYLSKVAARTAPRDVEHRGTPRPNLTGRERQILQLLADDHDLYTIADELYISYATVRNHVQHILAKLRVHSIMEAVACHLIQRPGPFE